MKKIQVVFAAVALLVASAAAFANTLTMTTTYYKHVLGTSNCSGSVVSFVNCDDQSSDTCNKIVNTGPGQTTTFIYSVREQDPEANPPVDRCFQLTRYLGSSPTKADLP